MAVIVTIKKMKKFIWRLTESECCTWSCFCQVFNPKRSCSQSKMQAIYQNESANSSNALVTATKPKVLIKLIHFLLFAVLQRTIFNKWWW